jgi:hypothetical protein
MFNPSPLARGLLAAVLVAALHGAALAASTSTRFEPAVQVAGSRLQLNGAGTRFKAIFKIYDLALYTPRKVGSSEELLALPGAKRLQFTALRELSSTDLGRLFLRGMADNVSPELIQKHTLSNSRLSDALSGRSRLHPGDTFAMDFIPGKGTQFYIQGQPQGEPVGDAEFFGMVLNIWFGARPADAALRDAMLGHEKAPERRGGAE